MKTLFAGLLLAAAAGGALAQATPAGLWKTIDDDTKAEKSLVRVTESAGVFTGKVEKILTDKTDAKCTECSDERKGQPVQGMVILRDIKPDPDDKSQWIGGDILDPNNGKVYKVRIRAADGGKKLEVRGYIGTPLLGRTQTWIRVE
ncbi:MAG TPA: DUF2147 domain-containing protein [Rubrivivax sp.]|nr:DUF2147 domain-containing protein [Rubrivivax sp.]HPO20803.1 DUF2147 domain-containing protein [Rubrivivax sp.]